MPKKAIIFITYIFRACINLAYFPDRFKHAKVIAIPKPGKDPTSPNSYRPISLLSSLSKLLEKIVQTRIKEFMSLNNILPSVQFGFREGHSTNHQLLRVTNHIRRNCINGKSTGMLTFDVEKAFDGVWHKGLLHKMFKLNFPLYLVKLVKSFLYNRSFLVAINDEKSNIFNIVAGVPQGSVLSPTLYNIYTSDLKIVSSNCEMALFADDTAIYSSAKNPSKILKNLNSASKCLTDYCVKWKIKLNASKTQATFFTKRRSERFLPDDEVSINNSKIPWKNDLKYLGVTLDKKLTFSKHIELSAEKTLKYIGILYPLINRKSKLSRFNKLTLFKTVFQSILLYASPIWGNCAECHLKKLQIVQNKCLKIILNLPYDYPTVEVHKMSKIPFIKDQITKINHQFVNKLQYAENPLIYELEML